MSVIKCLLICLMWGRGIMEGVTLRGNLDSSLPMILDLPRPCTLDLLSSTHSWSFIPLKHLSCPRALPLSSWLLILADPRGRMVLSASCLVSCSCLLFNQVRSCILFLTSIYIVLNFLLWWCFHVLFFYHVFFVFFASEIEVRVPWQTWIMLPQHLIQTRRGRHDNLDKVLFIKTHTHIYRYTCVMLHSDESRCKISHASSDHYKYKI